MVIILLIVVLGYIIAPYFSVKEHFADHDDQNNQEDNQEGTQQDSEMTKQPVIDLSQFVKKSSITPCKDCREDDENYINKLPDGYEKESLILLFNKIKLSKWSPVIHDDDCVCDFCNRE